MKVQIRQNVFETNSSSTHSISICSQEDYDKWKNGELYWYDGTICSKEEIIAIIRDKNAKYIERGHPEWCTKMESDEDFENFIDDNYDIESYDSYGNDYETFHDTFTTKSGDKIVAFGYFGYDG